jgi:N4-gp56 family major capsid protein
MATTEFGTNHPLAVKVWSKKLMVQSIAKTWVGKFIGSDTNSLIYQKNELTKSAGDLITYGLRMKLNGDGIQGDATLEGQEENLVTYADTITINQLRHATRSKGKMSEQRVPFSVRQENMDGLSDWWAERWDVSAANHLAGNTVQSDTRYTGNNAITAASANNIMLPPDVTSDEASLSNTTTNTFNLSMIDRAVARAKTMDQLTTTQPIIRPIMIDGGEHYVCFLHPYQVRDMRTNVNTGQFLDIQKAATSGGEKTKNAIFTGALGMYNGVVLHEWSRLPAAIATAGTAVASTRRAVFAGAQAACIAFGQGDGRPNKMDWTEELFDYKNQLGVEAGAIFGLKKTRFDSKDFATIVLPTYAAAS